MPTFEELQAAKAEEDKKRLEAFRQMMELAGTAAQRATPTQDIDTSALTLSPEQIKEYQGRLTRNLDERDRLRDYLMGFLERDTIDPTAPHDPTRDFKTRLTANELADEMKRKDRKGKNPIANIFRNIDYALGDGRGRDLAIASGQQKLAIENLQTLLKDSGTEIRNTAKDQAGLVQNLLKLTQTGAATQGNLAAKQAQVEQNAVNSSHNNTMTGIKGNEILNLGGLKRDLLQSQVDINKHRLNYAPYGVGESKEMRDAMTLVRLEKEGKTEEAAKLRQEMQATKMMNAILTQGSKPNESSSRTMIHWDKDSLGRTVPIPYSSTTSKPDSPMQRAFKQLMATGKIPMVGAAQAQSVENKGVNAATPSTLLGAAQGTQPSTRAAKAVTKAISNVQNEGLRQTLAADAIKYKLTPSQIEEDEKDRQLGKRYKIDWNPRAVKGLEGTGGSAEIRKDTRLQANLRSNIDTATNSIMKAAVDGTLEKAMGLDFYAGKNVGSKIYAAMTTTIPDKLKGFVTSSEDPDFALRRIFPNMGQDSDTQQFRMQFKQFMSSIGFDIQKDSTGLQALGQEMERIKSMLPQGTDDPTVVMSSMLTLAVKKKVEGYLLNKGYGQQDVEKIATLAGDYVAPRVSMLQNVVRDAKADYANHRIKDRNEIAKKFTFSQLDPDDIIGAALDAKGIPFEALPVQIRRIGDTTPTDAEKRASQLPKKETMKGVTGTPLDSILEPIMRRVAEEQKDKSKFRIFSSPFE